MNKENPMVFLSASQGFALLHYHHINFNFSFTSMHKLEGLRATDRTKQKKTASFLLRQAFSNILLCKVAVEYLKLEGTPKDHQVQLPASHRTI